MRIHPVILLAFASPLSVYACTHAPTDEAYQALDAPILTAVNPTPCADEDDQTAAIRMAVADARAMAGVPALRCDAAAVAATTHHCRYAVVNHDLSHVETPGKREFTGVSFQDRLAAQGFGDLASAEVLTSVEGSDGVSGPYGLLNTVYHRAPLLRPYNTSFGIGHDDGCVTIDLGRPSNGNESGVDVVWPPDGARNVPTTFVSRFERPNPVPGRDVVGAPVSLLTTGSVVGVEATMVDASGARVDGVIITLASDVAQLVHAGDVHFVPREPLSPHTRYTTHFMAIEAESGRTIDLSTTFTTGDE